MAKKKKAVKTSSVKYLYAPQYEELSLKKIYEYLSQFEIIKDYFPEDRDLAMLPRQVSII